MKVCSSQDGIQVAWRSWGSVGPSFIPLSERRTGGHRMRPSPALRHRVVLNPRPRDSSHTSTMAPSSSDSDQVGRRGTCQSHESSTTVLECCSHATMRREHPPITPDPAYLPLQTLFPETALVYGSRKNHQLSSVVSESVGRRLSIKAPRQHSSDLRPPRP